MFLGLLDWNSEYFPNAKVSPLFCPSASRPPRYLKRLRLHFIYAHGCPEQTMGMLQAPKVHFLLQLLFLKKKKGGGFCVSTWWSRCAITEIYISLIFCDLLPFVEEHPGPDWHNRCHQEIQKTTFYPGDRSMLSFLSYVPLTLHIFGMLLKLS